ncbi:MAG: hypothetical protein DLM73_04375 [Chthoniobacterales bacterium]|nr:MAG: hypothetical protein DLM73_04375 [Chthoniobacterales bacterium]
MNRVKFLLAIATIAWFGSISLLRGQEPPLPAATETPNPSPSASNTRPELNIPEIPMSVEPSPLVPNTSPASHKKAPPLTELDAAFQKTPLGGAAEEQRLHLEWRQLQNQTAHDPEVVAAKEAVNGTKTDVEKRARLHAYYKIYYAHMLALATAPEVKNYLEAKKNEILNSLAQPRVRPEPTTHHTQTPRPTPASTPTPTP